MNTLFKHRKDELELLCLNRLFEDHPPLCAQNAQCIDVGLHARAAYFQYI